jgi:hypothetical protein
MKFGDRHGKPRHQQGLVTVIILALVILLALFLEVNLRVLTMLKGEIELIEASGMVSEAREPEADP